jgi:hypothetical protein
MPPFVLTNASLWQSMALATVYFKHKTFKFEDLFRCPWGEAAIWVSLGFPT